MFLLSILKTVSIGLFTDHPETVLKPVLGTQAVRLKPLVGHSL